nr:hypothetical protein [uncultured Desulfobulbus sp.]
MPNSPDTNTADLWEMLGDLDEDQPLQLLTQLFFRNEERLQKNPEDVVAMAFFRDLSVLVEQVRACNLNRR